MKKRKIKKHLQKIKINEDNTWYVPNRKQLKLSLNEFIEFERMRITSTEKQKKKKYKNHYQDE